MNDTAVLILFYKNVDHFFRCLDSIMDTPNCDFYVMENKSDIDVSERIKEYVRKGKVKKYAFFENHKDNPFISKISCKYKISNRISIFL